MASSALPIYKLLRFLPHMYLSRVMTLRLAVDRLPLYVPNDIWRLIIADVVHWYVTLEEELISRRELRLDRFGCYGELSPSCLPISALSSSLDTLIVQYGKTVRKQNKFVGSERRELRSRRFGAPIGPICNPFGPPSRLDHTLSELIKRNKREPVKRLTWSNMSDVQKKQQLDDELWAYHRATPDRARQWLDDELDEYFKNSS